MKPRTPDDLDRHDWAAQASEALAQAKKLPPGLKRSKAIRKAGQLRIAADMKNWLMTKEPATDASRWLTGNPRPQNCKARTVFRNSWFSGPTPKKGCRMSEVERLRDKVEKCRQLALVSGDVEIGRRLVALANEFEAKAVRAGAQTKRGQLAQLAENPDERRKLALINFTKAWQDARPGCGREVRNLT
jgi:hypothetical protein